MLALSRSRERRRVAVGAGVVGLMGALAAVPLVPGDAFRFATGLLFVLFWNIVLAESYDLVGGHLGYINLGHACFFGIGGYAFGIALDRSFPLPLAFLAAPALAAGFAAAIGLPLFRLKGAYFSLATFGLVGFLELVALNLEGLTGGTGGLYLASGFRDTPAYYLALGTVGASILTNALVARSRFGLALASIREDEEVAQGLGVHLLRHKVLTLMMSAGFAGFIGAVFVWKSNYADPPLLFGLERALVPVVMAMLGGSGTVTGPVVGTVFLLGIEQLLWTRMAYLHLATYGVILAAVGLYLPGGIVRTTPRLIAVMRRLASAAPGSPPPGRVGERADRRWPGSPP